MEGPGAGLVGEARVPKLHLALHALLVAIPVWVATLYFNGELFGFHATFMSLGFMLFMSEGAGSLALTSLTRLVVEARAATAVPSYTYAYHADGGWRPTGVWLASRAVVLPAGEDRLSLLKLHMYAQVNSFTVRYFPVPELISHSSASHCHLMVANLCVGPARSKP